jgi:hypothetical protein
MRVESRGDVVAREQSAQRKGLRGEAAVPFLLGANVGDVIAAQAFLLQLGVNDGRASVDFDVRDRIGEVRRIIQSDVVLDDLGLRSGAGADDVARVNGKIGFRGDEQQMDRLFDHAPGGEIDGCPIRPERGVERREAVDERFGIAGEQRFEPIRALGEGLRQAADVGAARQATKARQTWRMTPVDEHQQMAVAQGERGDLIRTHAVQRFGHELEGALLEGRHAGVLPVLVSKARKAQLGEAPECDRARALQPRQPCARAAGLELRELLAIKISGCRVHHGRAVSLNAWACVSTQP